MAAAAARRFEGKAVLITGNVKGVWLGLKTVAPLLRARGGGAIVNTASLELAPEPPQRPYTSLEGPVVPEFSGSM